MRFPIPFLTSGANAAILVKSTLNLVLEGAMRGLVRVTFDLPLHRSGEYLVLVRSTQAIELMYV